MSEVGVYNIKKSFHGKVVLSIPSFEVQKGEIISIVGANGAGKSTLIKIISGLMLQDSGDVVVFGNSNTSAAIHKDVKFVLESGRGYYEYLTADQNIDYFLHLNRISRTHIKKDLENLFEILDFNNYINILVSELSQGTRQKLSLIIALLCKPKVLCLDEPTNGLDIVAKKQFAKLLQALCQEKETIVLMTTHDIYFAKEISTRVCVMNKGKINQEGSFSEIFGKNNKWIKYRIGISYFEKDSFDKLFPELSYHVNNEKLIVEVKDSHMKNQIFNHFDIIFFEEVEESIEEILYGVIHHD
ncbi:MAG: ABC transporter ATP-binding protein [Streptococcus orisratti]|uniref:ABC transporter ATP-binding protein n=1 Tax=Streptococcus orisratti TaxID=114652 RepID=UPI0023539DE2|nr:ABC transporter ATP-binding protein [Streptococcus orisratti]MCI7677677.1 ABC transporter ATP-binding protein [Streptococcus orisratti]MDY5634963.1 ABC transporter ATP-binding protein [Streptococcus orisratti]